MNQNQMFRRSSYLEHLKRVDEYIIWHRLFGNPLVISAETLKFLDFFSLSMNLSKIVESYSLESQKNMIDSLISNYYLVPMEFDERSFLEALNVERRMKIITGNMIKNLSLIMSETCNFNCSYCIHHHNILSSKRHIAPQSYMSFAVAKKAIDFYMDLLLSRGITEAYINFGGGEPLLNWQVIEEVLTYCKIKYDSKINVTFSLNTNASLLNYAVAHKLKKYSVKVATSLDGLPAANDAVRKHKNGKGTFEMIWAGINILKDANYAVDGFSTTITDENFFLLDERLIDFVAENNMTELRLDIDVIGMVSTHINDIVIRIIHLYKYAQKKGITMTGFWARPSENLSCSPTDNVSFCGAKRGNNLCVNPLGDIYPCGYSGIRLANLSEINDLFSSGSVYLQYVLSHLPGQNEFCLGCMLEGQCLGGCGITMEYANSQQTIKVKKMCDFYKRMTSELLLI